MGSGTLPAVGPAGRRAGLGMVLALVPAGLAAQGAPPATPAVILVSVDGLRHDYLDRLSLPAFQRLIREGVRASLVPAFPTKTFPNHYTLVTGLYPAQHGIVANVIYDAARDDWFGPDKRDAVRDARWWLGEPVWVGAEKAGIKTAPMFWPGAEADVGGVRPTYRTPFDNWMPDSTRVDSVLGWLDLPVGRRPGFVTLYFSDVDVAAHEEGLGPGLDSALAVVDRAMARLLAGLVQRGLMSRVNLVVVSDHGHSPMARDRVIVLDDLLPPGLATVVDWSPVLQLRPEPGLTDSVYALLAGRHPHLRVYRKDALPPRLHYGGSPRIQPIVGIADLGWVVMSREQLARWDSLPHAANHGWDPAAPDMWGTFVARGPAFRRGYVGAAFGNIHVYALLCELLGIDPAPNAGSTDSTKVLLRSGGAGD